MVNNKDMYKDKYSAIGSYTVYNNDMLYHDNVANNNKAISNNNLANISNTANLITLMSWVEGPICVWSSHLLSVLS